MGQKTSELQLNDRDFQTGDFMNLLEFNSSELTGEVIRTVITHVLSNYTGLKKGYCIISFHIING